jgi:hypothetical protein
VGTFYIENGPSTETWSVLAVCLGMMLIAYGLTRRRNRRRRLIAMELRLESAWQDMKASLGLTGREVNSPRTVGLSSAFLGGLQAGPQGRVLSMHPLGEEGKAMSAYAAVDGAISAVVSTELPGENGSTN